MLLTLLLITPVLAAALCFFFRKTLLIEMTTLFASIVELFIGILITVKVSEVGSYSTKYFSVDALSAIILLVTTLVALSAFAYSIGYFREELKKNVVGPTRVRQFYGLAQLFVFAMLFALSTTNPIMMWIAIEITTLSTAFLISFYNEPKALEAAWKYLIINSVGLLLGFFGTLLFLTAVKDGGVFVTWETLFANAHLLNPVIAKVAFVFMFIGYGTKVGFVPMHTWKPDAYSRAPSPLGALFSGPLLCIAFLAILRYKTIFDLVFPSKFTNDIFVFFGIISLLISAFIIFTQKNFKRLFAYSSIEHAGIMALGFGFGGAGVFAAILHMIYHSLAKPVAFFISGNLLLKFDTVKIQKIRGVLKTMPLTGALMLAVALALTGVPPFGLFITEFNILVAGSHKYLIVAVLALIALAIIFAGFLYHTSNAVFGASNEEVKKGELNLWTTLPPVILMVILFTLGLYIPSGLLGLLNSAAAIIK